MSVDLKKLSAFFAKLEWEGGYEAIVDYGIAGGTGDDKLDRYIEQLEAALEGCRRRERELFDEYGDQLNAEEE